MGENSKNIGEFGEDTIYKFLNRIGWENGQTGVNIECKDAERHPGRKTHGIDYLYAYSCPLIQQRLVHTIVSIKAKIDSYGKYPNSLFKQHLSELSDICNCYDRSDQKGYLQTQFLNSQSFEKDSIIGVLFWIVNNKAEASRDIINETSTAQIDNLDEHRYESAYIVDLKRIEFIWNILNDADKNYPNWAFQYIETGMNFREDIKMRSGNILPVEYINSSIIPIKSRKEEKDSLIIYTITDFNEDDFRRLVGLANKLSLNFASKVYISFPDYNQLNHSNMVARVLNGFSDISLNNKIVTTSYNDNLVK